MSTEEDRKLYEDIGYIKGKVEKLSCIEKKIDDLDARMDKIEGRMSWVFGWAAGVAGVVSLVGTYFWQKFKNLL